jgi:hypothetical protein
LARDKYLWSLSTWIHAGERKVDVASWGRRPLLLYSSSINDSCSRARAVVLVQVAILPLSSLNLMLEILPGLQGPGSTTVHNSRFGRAQSSNAKGARR